MELNYIAIRGLYHTEAQMLIDWFEEIRERYEENIDYTNEIIDDLNNNISFELKKFNFSTHETYIKLQFRGYNNEEATIQTLDFNEIVLK